MYTDIQKRAQLRSAPILVVAMLILCFAFPALASQAPQELHQTVVKEIEVRAKSQKQEDAWATKKESLTSRFHVLDTENQYLERERKKYTGLLANRRAAVAEAKRKIEETEKVRAQLVATLEAIVGRLETFVGRDLPFLSTERSRRFESIREVLADPEQDFAEKCRRVMEALMVETEYGRGFQVYEQTIDLENAPVAVDVLRIGRLSLFFRTPDGKVVGWYDPAGNSWQRLPSDYERHINQAAEMALRRRPADVVKLPLGKIEIK